MRWGWFDAGLRTANASTLLQLFLGCCLNN
jgi:hypothetical protein